MCLAITIPISLTVYSDEASSANHRTAIIVGASLVSAAITIGSIGAYAGTRWAYARRRRPWAWVAIRALDASSREISPSIPALGIGSRDGNLAIRLPQGVVHSIKEGDSFLALNSHTRERVGLVDVVEVLHDSCICVVFDKMDHQEFWEGLENRMNRDFAPPPGAEFSRLVNQDHFDFVRRQIRNWAG